MSLARVVAEANNLTPARIAALLATPDPAVALPLLVGRSCAVGFVTPAVVALIRAVPAGDPAAALFEVSPHSVSILPTDPATRTLLLERLLLAWRDDPNVPLLQPSKWRNERYSVWDDNGRVAFEIERAASGLFGVRVYGCHVNGYVVIDNEIKMWVARRSYTKQTYPGMLDNMVGGGLPHGISPTDNVIKECFEEAGLTITASSLKPVSIITSFMDSSERGWVPDTEYLYDLRLDESFKPVCQDGEVHSFELMSMGDVRRHLINGEFMPESGLCAIDFMLRHGIIDPSTEPDYEYIACSLRRLLPFPGPRYSA
ncbi:hypothetical protein HDU84_006628 [Entophlyctis sp. JEL0112]|nr:hypothetical protein HDU84_006628 [Entophlyctis sp. JEL0112]